MKEILHSKVMIGFILFVLGFTYVNSTQMQTLEESTPTPDLIVMNS